MTRASDRGVSPVIGTVLVVAIVVVLAAVVGAYVLQLGDQQPVQAPQTAIVADYSERTTGNGEYLNLSFESGDKLDRSELSLVLSGARDSSGNDVELTGDPLTQTASTISSGAEVSIHAGHFTGVGPGEHLDLGDATLRLVWTPDDTDETKTYVVYRWPDPSRR